MEQFELILKEAGGAAAASADTAQLEAVRVKYLGKSGDITALLRHMKDIAPAERPAYGKRVNDLREAVEGIIAARESVLTASEKSARLAAERLDVTMPGKRRPSGGLHPLTVVKNLIVEAFLPLGFKLCEGREIEQDYYNFQALNIPKDHPARDMQDTFYINDNILLRTHTSPAQVHVMEREKPPIRILSHGKVYRCDDDATHSPMFHQIEGLAVEQNLSLCDLQGVLDAFARKLFSQNARTRFRPSHFPFTEPSVEVDVSCAMCGGNGCRLCKGTGWIEILGAGMVNRRVLSGCGIDPDVYTGFAFGMGIERIAMLKYGLPDMRLLFENDTRFLTQFTREG